MPGSFFFERSRLEALASRYSRDFATAQPFPHVVIDDFLPPDVIKSLVEAYPETTSAWTRFDNTFEVKSTQRDEEAMPEAVRLVVQQFNGQVFLEFLERLTGIEGLLADPGLTGGGMHQISRGGWLKVHADFNEHAHLHVDRRLNALLYLNEDWDDSYGGHLELWNRDMSAMGARIAPIANRLVVFATTRTSYHGHPDPLACPPERSRRSLAWYYYTAPRRAFKWRHSTLFQARPDEPEVAQRVRAGRHPGRDLVLRLTPVALKNRYESIRRQARR